MSLQAAFLPIGPTANVVVSASAQTITSAALQPAAPQSSPINANAYRMVNSGTVPIFWLYGDPNVPGPNGTSPPAVTAANGIPMFPNSAETFSGPPNAAVQVIGASGSTFYVTAGEGQ